MHIWKLTLYKKGQTGLAKQYFYQNINDIHYDMRQWDFTLVKNAAPFVFRPTAADSKYQHATVEAVEVLQEAQSVDHSDKQELKKEEA